MSYRNIHLKSVRPAGLQPAESATMWTNEFEASGVQLLWPHRPQAYVPA
jgi:hypothetical protein